MEDSLQGILDVAGIVRLVIRCRGMRCQALQTLELIWIIPVIMFFCSVPDTMILSSLSRRSLRK